MVSAQGTFDTLARADPSYVDVDQAPVEFFCIICQLKSQPGKVMLGEDEKNAKDQLNALCLFR
jgi:hypothetical protein